MNYDPDNIFAKIAAKELPSTIVYEDDRYLAFTDLYPKAPIHYLVIPKEGVARFDDLPDAQAMGELMQAAVRTAEANGLEDYRLVVNIGPGGGQEVFHVHVHVMGGWEKS